MKQKPKLEVLPGYEPLTDWVLLASETHMIKVEEWMRLYIKQKPRYLPSPLWEWFLRQLVARVSDDPKVTIR